MQLPNILQKLLIDASSIEFWKEMVPNMLVIGTFHLLIVTNFLLILHVMKTPKPPKFLQVLPFSFLLPTSTKNVLFLGLFYFCLALVLPSLAIIILKL